MTRKSLISAIQMCSSDDLNENLSVAAKLIQEVKDKGAQLVVLPEMFALMNDDMKMQSKEEIGHGKIQDFLAKQAQQHKLWIVGGTIPITSVSNPAKFRAACLIYDDRGQMVARYDKIHMFDVSLSEDEAYHESSLVEPGREIVVLDTPIGKLGLAVCFDVRFPQQFKQLAQKGAQIIALPSAFTMKTGKAHWELLMRARAIDTFCYMIGACQGGTHPSGRQTYGHSMVVEPWGKIIAYRDNEGPGFILAELDLDRVQNARRSIPGVLEYLA